MSSMAGGSSSPMLSFQRPFLSKAASDRFTFFSRSSSKEVAMEMVVAGSPPSNEKVKQVVILCHGRDRDAGVMYSKARSHCSSRSSTLLVAPCFYNGDDSERLQGAHNLLIWKGNDWGEGACSIRPQGAGVSSFEALDALVRRYGDKLVHPKLKHIVIAGHSLGAQLVQRYAILGEDHNLKEIEVSYVVMNPSTYLYPHHSFKYKYGLIGIEEALSVYPSALVSEAQLRGRIRNRTVHYLRGTKDNGVGDERHEASKQGRNRKERFLNWQSYLTSQGLLESVTFEEVAGASHDVDTMIGSDPGRKHVFPLQ